VAWTLLWWTRCGVGAKAELEGDMGDPQMGLQARLMSQALRS